MLFKGQLLKLKSILDIMEYVRKEFDMFTILLVEDSETIIMGLKYALEQEKYNVKIAKNVIDAKKEDGYDLVLLDITLPDGNGFELFKEIKQKNDVPVIFLTARDEETNVVKGLDLGAEDYVVKPFKVRELISRIKVALRRYNKITQNLIECKGITIDTENREVKSQGKIVELTGLEYRILLMLFTNKNKLVTREMLLDKIWDVAGNFVNDNTLTVYIKRIREKIGDSEGKIVKTVRGIGYRVDDEKE